MKQNTIITTLFYKLLFAVIFIATSNQAQAQDSCLVNDVWTDATLMTSPMSDQGFVCIDGCNLYSAPNTFLHDCEMEDYPTVWYKVRTDDGTTMINVSVHSADFESPLISVFKSNFLDDQLFPVSLPGSSSNCIIGAEGLAKVTGVNASANTYYYIAVSSLYSIGGNFELCVSAISMGSACVTERDIEVIARSNGGSLNGPFDPGETVSICLNVESYSAAGNGCQWFQGLVPVFGNGWDPVSFVANGEPSNATLNGVPTNETGNGLYGASTWSWFTDVDYHYDRPSLTISDLDGNGTVDLCNTLYEADCPQGGVTGGCCGQCWGTPLGDILPPGWFAYGINGSCATPGPPVRVDWGDGNTCGGGMGPWSFCFDLTTRGIPDCMTDTTKKDCSVGFFTFADGETGAWTGNASVCALDASIKLSLKAKCGRVTYTPTEVLPDLCPGDTLEYVVEQEGIDRWEWNISPFWAVPYLLNTGDNGFVIQAPLVASSPEPVEINATLIGYIDGSPDKLVKKFSFQMMDNASCGIISSTSNIIGESKLIQIQPIPAQEEVIISWTIPYHANMNMEIRDINGRPFDKVALPRDGNQLKWNIEKYPTGIYIISIRNGEAIHTRRMVKI